MRWQIIQYLIQTPYKKRCTKVEIGNALTYMILKDIPAQYYLNLIQKDEYALFTESIRPPSKDDIYEFQKRLDPRKQWRSL